MTITPIELERSPEEVFAGWPRDQPLAALWSGDQAGHSRWTVLARPSGVVRPEIGGRIVPEGRGGGRAAGREGEDLPPLATGWIGCISYDAGGHMEPKAREQGLRKAPSAWPLVEWWRVDDALVFDHARRRWWRVGEPPIVRAGGGGGTFDVSALRSVTGRARFVRDVERVLEYIRAGDVYQASLAHELRGAFRGSARGLFLTLARAARPWYGAYLEADDQTGRRALLSMSPELFLRFDAGSRRVITRPMKGTRPGGASALELERSEKDRAELTMIVDLMRNDLGRVCEFGSVRVETAREIERHGGGNSAGGVLQATGAVSGVVREGLGAEGLVRATFPGGSVTGAPKIRAMQIIDELEPVARGPYCGSVGFVGDDGSAVFNITIRTALVEGEAGAGCDGFEGGVIRYSVGAGIVADSEPEKEWRETLDKAGPVRAVTTIEDEVGAVMVRRRPRIAATRAARGRA